MQQTGSMILFFPQYQAGYVPSNIPVGTASLRGLFQASAGFAEVPLQETDIHSPATEGNIRFRKILMRQMRDAAAIVNEVRPDFIFTTGGDCGGSFASIAYMNEKYGGKIGVLWIDAHADIHTPSTSPSGNYHGMVLRNLMGHDEFDVRPSLPLCAEQIAYLGLRDTEKEEDDFIAANGIPRFNAAEVMKDNAPLDAVVDRFRKNGITHLHLHVDCDVMDEKIFPYVHVPEPDGLSLERLLEVLQYLREKMPVSSCCLTEYAPQKEGEGLDIVRLVCTDGLGIVLP